MISLSISDYVLRDKAYDKSIFCHDFPYAIFMKYHKDVIET